RRTDAQCERLGVSDMKTAQPGFKQRRLSVPDKLLLALLTTATVLPMLGVIEAFGRHHLLCASMASSAFLIYWHPQNEMNSGHAVVASTMPRQPIFDLAKCDLSQQRRKQTACRQLPRLELPCSIKDVLDSKGTSLRRRVFSMRSLQLSQAMACLVLWPLA